MNKKDMRDIVKTAISLFLICAVAAGLLAAVGRLDLQLLALFAGDLPALQVEEPQGQAENEARKGVLPAAEDFAEKTLDDGTVYYEGTAEGNTVGYVFTVSSAGYGGEIKLTVGINSDGAVTGLTILSINETPGLGMNAKKEAFISQFTGKSGKLSVVKNKTPGDGEILAITSATITSKALTNAVNDALTLYTRVSGQEG